jgi:hypothetical protein
MIVGARPEVHVFVAMTSLSPLRLYIYGDARVLLIPTPCAWSPWVYPCRARLPSDTIGRHPVGEPAVGCESMHPAADRATESRNWCAGSACALAVTPPHTTPQVARHAVAPCPA